MFTAVNIFHMNYQNDLKAANLLRTRAGRLYLIDYGLASRTIIELDKTESGHFTNRAETLLKSFFTDAEMLASNTDSLWKWSEFVDLDQKYSIYIECHHACTMWLIEHVNGANRSIIDRNGLELGLKKDFPETWKDELLRLNKRLSNW